MRQPTEPEQRILDAIAAIPGGAHEAVQVRAQAIRAATAQEGGLSLRLELIADYLEALRNESQHFAMVYHERETQLGDILADIEAVRRLARLVIPETEPKKRR